MKKLHETIPRLANEEVKMLQQEYLKTNGLSKPSIIRNF